MLMQMAGVAVAKLLDSEEDGDADADVDDEESALSSSTAAAADSLHFCSLFSGSCFSQLEMQW